MKLDSSSRSLGPFLLNRSRKKFSARYMQWLRPWCPGHRLRQTCSTRRRRFFPSKVMECHYSTLWHHLVRRQNKKLAVLKTVSNVRIESPFYPNLIHWGVRNIILQADIPVDKFCIPAAGLTSYFAFTELLKNARKKLENKSRAMQRAELKASRAYEIIRVWREEASGGWWKEPFIEAKKRKKWVSSSWSGVPDVERPSDEGRRRHLTRRKLVVNMGRAGSCFTSSRAGGTSVVGNCQGRKFFWDLKFSD